MFTWIRERLKGVYGFTLIELVGAVVIIGVIAAIAIPAYAGHRQLANDAAVESDTTNTIPLIEAQKQRPSGIGEMHTVRVDDETVELYNDDTVIETIHLSDTVTVVVEGNAEDYIVCGWSSNGRKYTSQESARVFQRSTNEWMNEPSPCTVSLEEEENPGGGGGDGYRYVAEACVMQYRADAQIVSGQQVASGISTPLDRINFTFTTPDGVWVPEDEIVDVTDMTTGAVVGQIPCLPEFEAAAGTMLLDSAPTMTTDSALNPDRSTAEEWEYFTEGVGVSTRDEGEFRTGSDHRLSDINSWNWELFQMMPVEAHKPVAYDPSLSPIYEFATDTGTYGNSLLINEEGSTVWLTPMMGIGDVAMTFTGGYFIRGGGSGTWDEYVEMPEYPEECSGFGCESDGETGVPETGSESVYTLTSAECSAHYEGNVDILSTTLDEWGDGEYDYRLTGTWDVTGTYGIRETVRENGAIISEDIVESGRPCRELWDAWATAGNITFDVFDANTNAFLDMTGTGWGWGVQPGDGFTWDTYTYLYGTPYEASVAGYDVENIINDPFTLSASVSTTDTW